MPRGLRFDHLGDQPVAHIVNRHAHQHDRAADARRTIGRNEFAVVIDAYVRARLAFRRKIRCVVVHFPIIERL